MNEPPEKKPKRVTITVTEDLGSRFRALMARGAFGPGTTDHAPAARAFFRRMADRMEAGLTITTEPIGRVPQNQGVHWTLRLGDELHGRLNNLRHDHPIGQAAGTLTSFVEDLLRYGVPLEEDVFEGRIASRPACSGTDKEAPEVEVDPSPMATHPSSRSATSKRPRRASGSSGSASCRPIWPAPSSPSPGPARACPGSASTPAHPSSTSATASSGRRGTTRRPRSTMTARWSGPPRASPASPRLCPASTGRARPTSSISWARSSPRSQCPPGDGATPSWR